MKKQVMTIMVCLCACFHIFSATSQSAIVADQTTVNIQTYTHLSAGAVGKIADGNREIEAAQTVTAGISGFLSQVDVWVGRQSEATGNMVLSILNADYSPDTGDPLASFTIPASSIPSTSLFTYSLVTVDVRNASIFLNAGDSFAISLSAPDAPIVGTVWAPFSWAHESPGLYNGGLRFTRNVQSGNLSWSANGAADQALRTWMEPVGIPEPGTVLLLGLGRLMIKRRI